MALIFILLYAPIVTLVVLSFNASKTRAKWGGFTLHWYRSLFANTEIMNALYTTLIIALLASAIATVLGTLACIGINSMSRKSRTIFMGITNIPMLNGEIVMGISLMLLFIICRIQLGFGTILMAHITFNVPYVILSVMPKLKQTNKSTYEADPETLFPLLRERGKKTEEKMFAATGGVNTHKGIIFTIGILAAAAGISLRNYGKIESESVCRISLEMTKKELEQDLRKLKQSSGITHGEKIYCHLGEKGVRGLAMTGYPILCELTVPHMKQYIANNRDKNQINVQILLEIIAELTDTNVISRTSEKEMRWLQTEAKAILKAGGAFSENGLQKVRELNQICIRKNMSPGGAADLLAATIFLCRMETRMERRKGILQ